MLNYVLICKETYLFMNFSILVFKINKKVFTRNQMIMGYPVYFKFTYENILAMT